MTANEGPYSERVWRVLAGLGVLVCLGFAAAGLLGSKDIVAPRPERGVSALTSGSSGPGPGPGPDPASLPWNYFLGGSSPEPSDLEDRDRLPGVLLSDVRTALEEGEASGLVELETEELQSIFEGWRQQAVERMESLTLFRLPGGTEGPHRYEIAVEGIAVRLEIAVLEVEGRWKVVGARPAKRWTSPGAEEEKPRALPPHLNQR